MTSTNFQVVEPPTKRRKLNGTDSQNSITATNSDSPNNPFIICYVCKTKLNPCMVAIQCKECVSSNVILCTQCFKQGLEFNQHKRFHRYSVLSEMDVSIDTHKTNTTSDNTDHHKTWTAKDIWNLNLGIKRYGIGNWSQIAKIVNNPLIDKNECEQFAIHQYAMHGADHTTSHVREDEPPQTTPDPSTSHHTKSRKKKKKRHSITKKEMENNDKLLKCGYNSYRKEFEVKWKNNSEQIISEMYLSPRDTKSERELKLEGIRLYNRSVHDRENRKQCVLSPNYGVLHGLNEKYIKKQQHKEIFDNMAIFCRFAENKQQFRALVDGLIEETALREKISNIKHYLLNGITTAQDMSHIERYYKQYEHEKDDKYSLEEIAKYLKEQKRNELIYSKQRTNRRMHKETTPTHDMDKYKQVDAQSGINQSNDEVKNITNSAGFNALKEGEQKLCHVLKITPNQYKYIQKQIGSLVQKHGLSQHGNNIPTQLYIQIDDKVSAEHAANIKVGLVNPQDIV